jgi:MFS family permease
MTEAPVSETRPREDAEARFQAEARARLPRNFATVLTHGMLGLTGLRLLQAPTFLPAYVFQLSGSVTMVGVVRACQALGQFSTPFFGATLIEHRHRVLRMVFATGLAMRVQILLLALAGFWLGHTANLAAICILLGLFGLFSGMQTVTFQFLLSKVIPVERRGTLTGLRNMLSGLTAASLGVVGGHLVEANALGNGYASVFLAAFAMTALGLASLVFLREPSSPAVRVASSLRERFGELPALWRSDASYRRLILAVGLGVVGRMAMPYHIVDASERMEVTGETLGLLTGGFVIANTVGSLGWGLLADRGGFRNVLALAIATWIAGTLTSAYATDLTTLTVGYAAIGAGFGGFQLAGTNLVMEFGQREDLPMRIALTQSAQQLVSVFAPLAGAALATFASYRVLFWTSASIQLAAVAVTALGIREPRQR